MNPTNRALLIVDVQNDFVEGGALGVTGGKDVAARIGAYAATHGSTYAVVAASRDWHEADSSNGGHFHAPGEEPDFDATWPVHCVSEGPGSDYAPEFVADGLAHVTHHVRKGMGEPAYSAFEGVTDDGEALVDVLRAASVVEVDVAGLATDYCVRATVLDACQEGFRVRLLERMHAGVTPETSADALGEMATAGAWVATP